MSILLGITTMRVVLNFDQSLFSGRVNPIVVGIDS